MRTRKRFQNPALAIARAVSSDTALYEKYFHKMLNRVIYLAPAQFEALFVSTAHTKEDLDKTIVAHRESLFTISR